MSAKNFIRSKCYNSWKLHFLPSQPHSQGLSSSCPPGRGKMRDPGNEVATILFLIVMQQQPHSQCLSFSCSSVALDWGMEERGEDSVSAVFVKELEALFQLFVLEEYQANQVGLFRAQLISCQESDRNFRTSSSVTGIFLCFSWFFPGLSYGAFSLQCFNPVYHQSEDRCIFHFFFLFLFFFSLCATGSVRLKINGWVNVSFCLPHKVHNLNQGSIHIKVSFLQRRGIIKQRYTEIKLNTQESGRPVRVEFSSESCHPVV